MLSIYSSDRPYLRRFWLPARPRDQIQQRRASHRQSWPPAVQNQLGIGLVIPSARHSSLICQLSQTFACICRSRLPLGHRLDLTGATASVRTSFSWCGCAACHHLREQHTEGEDVSLRPDISPLLQPLYFLIEACQKYCTRRIEGESYGAWKVSANVQQNTESKQGGNTRACEMVAHRATEL